MTNVETLSQILQHKQDELRSILNNPYPTFHARRKHLRLKIASLEEQIQFIQENQ